MEHERTLPDMVVAELVSLGPVEQYRPRRGVYGISLGSGSGHLIICLAVTGRRARWSCTVGVMGERRGWVSERGGDSQADTEEEDGDIDALPSPTASEKLLYADEQRVDSVTFHLPNPPLFSARVIMQVQSTRARRARSAMDSGPLVYNGCAEWCTMANKHAGFARFIRSGTHIRQQAQVTR